MHTAQRAAQRPRPAAQVCRTDMSAVIQQLADPALPAASLPCASQTPGKRTRNAAADNCPHEYAQGEAAQPAEAQTRSTEGMDAVTNFEVSGDSRVKKSRRKNACFPYGNYHRCAA